MLDKQKVVNIAPTDIPTKVLISPKDVSPQAKILTKSKQNPLLLGLLVLIPIIGIGYFAYNRFVVSPQQQPKNKVQTAAVERTNLTITVSANGTVQPEQTVNVSPKTAGILKQLLVKEGDAVKQGQILAYADVPQSERIQAATEALTKVGLSDRLNSRPNQLFGGQQQRPCACKSSCFSVGR